MRILALMTVLALTAVLAPLGASADTGLIPATDRLFIAAGCPQDTPGTCTSTRWLGKSPGDANSNFLTATTPADEVLYRATGDINWRDYASDSSIPTGGYVMDASRDVEMSVNITNNALMVNETIHARVTLRHGDFQSTVLNGDDIEVLIQNPGTTATYSWDLNVPDELDGVTVTSVTAEIAVHGVNAQGGYIDQSGGSFVKIPHLVPAS